jgi:hypothetical protein
MREDTVDVAALAELLHETGVRHHSYEQSAPAHDWWNWYAAYLDARLRGRTPDDASDDAAAYMAQRPPAP